MNKSKTKTRQPSARRYFVAVHQGELMDAFARGFVAPRQGGLEAESLVTPAAVAHARSGSEWGEVVLIEVAAPSQEKTAVNLRQPLLLTDVIGCWARTADAAVEIDARLETFDDTVPGIVRIAVDPALFPDQKPVDSQDSLPLGSNTGDQRPSSSGEAAEQRDAVALEKIAGGLSMLCARAKTGGLGIDSLERILAVISSDEDPRDGVATLASHAYRALRSVRDESDDVRMFVSAAMGLKDLSPKQGLDPIAFVELLGNRENVAAFLETLRKVLDNRIELSDSKLDDSGMVGQRALLVFLLAPRAEELERWLRARPVGPIVAALASLLSGIYCGLGGLSRELKGPTPEAMLAVVRAASALLDGLPAQVRVVRDWDDKAAVREAIAAYGWELVARTKQPAELLSQLLTAARGAGLETRVNPGTGECTVLLEGLGSVTLDVAISAFRMGGAQVARLTLGAVGPRRGQPSKEFLATLMGDLIRPAVATIDESGAIRLVIELESPASVRQGVSELVRIVGTVGAIKKTTAATRKRVTKTAE